METVDYHVLERGEREERRKRRGEGIERRGMKCFLGQILGTIFFS
jgi:hypothetical protein